MKCTFSRNPIKHIFCDLYNLILKRKTKIWRSKRHVCRCCVCGNTLDSTKDKWCPEECGWIKLIGGRLSGLWICWYCQNTKDYYEELKGRSYAKT